VTVTLAEIDKGIFYVMADWKVVYKEDAELIGKYYIDNGVKGKNHLRVPAIIGKNGLVSGEKKIEGDMRTPTGRWALRHLYYRLDRVGSIQSRLPTTPLTKNCGWCDDPKSLEYNSHVVLPFAARHEKLWRTDAAYDLLIVLGYNDDPAISGRGSAIFLHCIADGKNYTAGCVAVKRECLLALSQSIEVGQHIIIGQE